MKRAPSIRLFHRFLRSAKAATSIEYAIIAAGIAVVLVGVISTLGGNVATMWTAIKAAFN
jgi:pilus assembly protein Flp/PilA